MKEPKQKWLQRGYIHVSCHSNAETLPRLPLWMKSGFLNPTFGGLGDLFLAFLNSCSFFFFFFNFFLKFFSFSDAFLDTPLCSQEWFSSCRLFLPEPLLLLRPFLPTPFTPHLQKLNLCRPGRQGLNALLKYLLPLNSTLCWLILITSVLKGSLII